MHFEMKACRHTNSDWQTVQRAVEERDHAREQLQAFQEDLLLLQNLPMPTRRFAVDEDGLIVALPEGSE